MKSLRVCAPVLLVAFTSGLLVFVTNRILEALLRSHSTNCMAVIMSDFLSFQRFRGLAKNTPQTLPQKSQEAVKQVVSMVVTHDVATHPRTL